jgi:hypothetical protein
MMEKNMGSADRVVRTLFAAGVVVAIVAGWIDGIAAVVLGVVAAVFVLTSAVGFCPLYRPFKLSTHKREHAG